MVDQAAKVNGRHRTDGLPGPEPNVSTICHELVRLGELQVRLFAIEGRQASRKLGLVVALMFLALAALVGGSIAGLAGIALFLDTHTSLGTWGAFAFTGGSAIVLATLLAIGAIYLFRANCRTLFQRSLAALSDNLDCIKSVLSRSDTR
jgi:hypothetical protein